MTKQVAIITIPNRAIQAGEYNAAYGHNTSHMAILEKYLSIPKSATMWTVYTSQGIEVNIEYSRSLGKRNREEINRFIAWASS